MAAYKAKCGLIIKDNMTAWGYPITGAESLILTLEGAPELETVATVRIWEVLNEIMKDGKRTEFENAQDLINYITEKHI